MHYLKKRGLTLEYRCFFPRWSF